MVERRTEIRPTSKDAAFLRALGARLARKRLQLDLTQQELAQRAGLSRSTVRRLEAGESTQLANFLRVLRGLGLGTNLDVLVPQPPKRLLQVLARRGHRRRRASGKRIESGSRGSQ